MAVYLSVVIYIIIPHILSIIKVEYKKFCSLQSKHDVLYFAYS